MLYLNHQPVALSTPYRTSLLSTVPYPANASPTHSTEQKHTNILGIVVNGQDHGVLKISGRDAAVDYSITKEKFNALKQQTVPTATPKDSDPEDDNDDENSDGSEQEDGMEVDTDGESESDDSDGELSDGDSKEKAGEGEEGGGAGAGLGRAAVEEKKQRASDVQQGCTIFVRNVAFDCGQEEVKERLSEFGNVRLALLVKDRATGMPRGTAFVKVSEQHSITAYLCASVVHIFPPVLSLDGIVTWCAPHLSNTVNFAPNGRAIVRRRCNLF